MKAIRTKNFAVSNGQIKEAHSLYRNKYNDFDEVEKEELTVKNAKQLAAMSKDIMYLEIINIYKELAQSNKFIFYNLNGKIIVSVDSKEALSLILDRVQATIQEANNRLIAVRELIPKAKNYIYDFKYKISYVQTEDNIIDLSVREQRSSQKRTGKELKKEAEDFIKQKENAPCELTDNENKELCRMKNILKALEQGTMNESTNYLVDVGEGKSYRLLYRKDGKRLEKSIGDCCIVLSDKRIYCEAIKCSEPLTERADKKRDDYIIDKIRPYKPPFKPQKQK